MATGCGAESDAVVSGAIAARTVPAPAQRRRMLNGERTSQRNSLRRNDRPAAQVAGVTLVWALAMIREYYRYGCLGQWLVVLEVAGNIFIVVKF